MDHVLDSSTLRCQVRFCCNPIFFVNSNYYLLRIEIFFMNSNYYLLHIEKRPFNMLTNLAKK
jgi:hypothetical protein